MSIQIFLLSILGALVYWTYAGCLTSFLAKKDSEPPIQSLDELQGKRSFRVFTFQKGSIYATLIKWAEKDVSKALYHKVQY